MSTRPGPAYRRPRCLSLPLSATLCLAAAPGLSHAAPPAPPAAPPAPPAARPATPAQAAKPAQAPTPAPAAGPTSLPPPAGPNAMYGGGGEGVAVKLAGGEWKLAEPVQPLGPGARLRTGGGRIATVDVDGARFWIEPTTQLMLPPDKRGPISMPEGAARVASDIVAGPKSTRVLRLTLPDGELRLRGSARVDLVGTDTLLSVYDGQAEYAPKRGAALKLLAGSGAVLHRAGKTKQGGLLAAPRFAAATSMFFVLPQGKTPTADVTVPFQPVEGATRYRLDVGKDDALVDRQLLGAAGQLPGDARAVALKLPRGRYHLRLQALDGDKLAGVAAQLPIEVVEVRGDRVAVAQRATTPGGPRQPVLTASGELQIELLPGQGKLGVTVDGQPQAANPGGVALRLLRGHHALHVTGEAGAQGDLLADVTRPSYAVEIVQGRPVSTGRHYEVHVRAQDGAGRAAQSVAGLDVRVGEQRLALGETGTGAYSGEVDVAPGQMQRLTISDADGVVTSAELHGSQE